VLPRPNEVLAQLRLEVSPSAGSNLFLHPLTNIHGHLSAHESSLLRECPPAPRHPPERLALLSQMHVIVRLASH
jgi:hypothetical protein